MAKNNISTSYNIAHEFIRDQRALAERGNIYSEDMGAIAKDTEEVYERSHVSRFIHNYNDGPSRLSPAP